MEKVNLQVAKDELLEVITYFVKRQGLVAQALQDLGLDLPTIGVLGVMGWILGAEGAKQLIEAVPNGFQAGQRHALNKMIENNTPKIDQSGIWHDQNGETWNYFMHGGGCRLTHPITAEVIDWDYPNIHQWLSELL